MKKTIKNIIIILSLIMIVSISSEITLKAKSIPHSNITLHVGEEFEIETFSKVSVDYSKTNPLQFKVYTCPTGKYHISNTNVVGIKSKYSKNERINGWDIRDGFYDNIVALNTGKATVTVLEGSKKLYIYNVTVKDNMLSPTQYSTFLDNRPYRDDIGNMSNKKAKELEKATREIIISLKLDKYNSDRERLYALAKWLNDYTKLEGEDEYLAEPYDALVKKKANILSYNLAGLMLLQNMGFECSTEGSFEDVLVKLDGSWYNYNVFYFIEGGLNDLYIPDPSDPYSYNEKEIDHNFGDTGIYYDCIYKEIYNKTSGKRTSESYTSNTKSHLPSWIINIETKQKNIKLGKSINLPNDQLSTNVYSSDTSIVAIENGKLVSKGVGIAIVYRYDDTYCDAFFVVVEPNTKKTSKTVKFKEHKKTTIIKSYKEKDIPPIRKVLVDFDLRLSFSDVWQQTLLSKFELALKNDNRLVTSYDKKHGYLKGYILFPNGKKQKIFNDKDFYQ